MKKIVISIMAMIILFSLTACNLPSTTSTLTEETSAELPKNDPDKIWFVGQYNIAKRQYINELNSIIRQNQGAITDLRNDAQKLSVSYQQEIKALKTQYANLGILNYMITDATERYNAKKSTYTKQITALENETKAAQAEINNPNIDSILAIIAQNCNMTSKEIYAYYYKYSAELDAPNT